MMVVIIDPVANGHSLKALESCLFVVCLDQSSQNWTDEDRSQKSLFSQMLHGLGPHVNGANRWYEKTIQVSCFTRYK